MKDSLFYIIIRPFLNVLVKVFLTPKYKGLENIPKDGKIIFAGTHVSILDPLLLGSSTKRSIHFLAKDELWKGPKKIIFNNLGLIPVNRREKDSNSLKLAREYLKSGKVIAIFPEGTLEKEKETLLPFKMGAIKLASDTKTKIVPFAITGSYKLFSRSLKIEFGKPVTVKDKDLEKENKRLEDVINKLIKEK